MNWVRWRKKRRAGTCAAALALFSLGIIFVGTGGAGSGNILRTELSFWSPVRSFQSYPCRQVREIAVPPDPSDEAVLGRPVAMALDTDRLWVADALDCAVKIFSREGRYLGSFGRKGQGPGELSFPSGVCAAGKTIAVADKMNFRIQFFDGEGKAAGGFKLPFAPDRILALGGGRLLVTSNPTGRQAGERLLHLHEPDGRPIWDGLEPIRSRDPVADAFRNMILVCAGTQGDFFVVFRSGERRILHYSASGDLAGSVEVDPGYRSRRVETPDAGRGRLKLDGFCWAAAFHQGRFYLSPPEILDGKDLGPGRTIAVVDISGRLLEVIELPCAVHRFLVAGDRLFAIDGDASLRVFEVAR